jgi:methyl-accepting chemotaxis protein
MARHDMASPGSFFRSIRFRLLSGSLGLTIIPLIVVAIGIGVISVRLATSAIEERAAEQLRSVHNVKSREVVSYFESLAAAVRSMASTGSFTEVVPSLRDEALQLTTQLPVPAAERMRALNEYYENDFETEFGRRNAGARSDMVGTIDDIGSMALALQYLYIARNPNPLGSKQQLTASPLDPTGYSELHAVIQNQMEGWIREYGFYDIFLIDIGGDLVYSYYKELDFGTNLRTGPWAESGLGQAFAAAALGADPRGVYLTDFAPYLPSYDAQAVFFGAPLFRAGERIGVLVAQAPIDRVNAVVNFGGDWSGSGLGQSGEAVLTGRDGSHRADVRAVSDDPAGYAEALLAAGYDPAVAETVAATGTSIGRVRDLSEPARAGVAGTLGVGRTVDYLKREVLAAWGPVEVLNQRFGFVLKLDAEEAFAAVAGLTRQITVAALLSLALLGLIGGLIALMLARSINEPLGKLTGVVNRVALGERDARSGMPAKDEIGTLATAFDNMLDERNAVQERIERENEQLNNSVIEIMTAVSELANRDLSVRVPVAEDVTGAVSDAINMMSRSTASALGDVRRVSDAVSEATSQVRQRGDNVAQVANAASDQATAAAAEIQQTAVALRLMGEQAASANVQAEQALKSTADALDLVRSTVGGISSSRDQIRETEKRVKRLAERSQEISTIVNIIGQIAERTSVLALNASMQAVAAGDAGRGFAVVADEVKRLAESSRQATQQIGTLVSAIQADTGDTLQAMNATITQVVEISRLADRAGGQMGDTRAATEQLVAAVRAIADTTKTQSESSQTLLARAYELLQRSQQTIDELDAQRSSTDQLAESAQQLVGTVGLFRLPQSA